MMSLLGRSNPAVVRFVVLPVLIVTLVLVEYQVIEGQRIIGGSPRIAALINRNPPLDEPADAHGYALGPSDAVVTLVEFGDLECWNCAHHWSLVQRILAEHPGQVRFVWRHWIKEHLHPHARKAAEAAECAGAQGKFWELYPVILANQSRLDTDSLMSYARQIDSLDAGAFDTCLLDGQMASVVQRDLDDGTRFGVTGTPTFFLNNRKVPAGDGLEKLVRHALIRQ